MSKCKVLKIGDYWFELVTIKGEKFKIDTSLMPQLANKLIDCCVKDEIIDIERCQDGWVVKT